MGGLRGGLMGAVVLAVYFGAFRHELYMLPALVVLPVSSYFGGWFYGARFERQ
jgi:hypothetical protein